MKNPAKYKCEKCRVFVREPGLCGFCVEELEHAGEPSEFEKDLEATRNEAESDIHTFTSSLTPEQNRKRVGVLSASEPLKARTYT